MDQFIPDEIGVFLNTVIAYVTFFSLILKCDICKTIVMGKATNIKYLINKFLLPIKNFFSFYVDNKNVYLISAAVSFAGIIISIASVRIIPPQIPLYYGMPEGTLQISSSTSLVAPSLISLILIILNLYIARFVKDPFVNKSLMLTSITVCILALITTIKIILLIGNI